MQAAKKCEDAIFATGRSALNLLIGYKTTSGRISYPVTNTREQMTTKPVNRLRGEIISVYMPFVRTHDCKIKRAAKHFRKNNTELKHFMTCLKILGIKKN